ncbi:MAG: hypothetical protein HYX71_12525 [Opitutae bacterium]|nr:hypothetical protein [Opitutae bacterium]
MNPFLLGRRTLEGTALRAPAASPLIPGAVAKHDAPAGHAPHIDLVKQGDKIVRIIVQCTCGERTEIECLYPPGQ